MEVDLSTYLTKIRPVFFFMKMEWFFAHLYSRKHSPWYYWVKRVQKDVTSSCWIFVGIMSFRNVWYKRSTALCISNPKTALVFISLPGVSYPIPDQTISYSSIILNLVRSPFGLTHLYPYRSLYCIALHLSRDTRARVNTTYFLNQASILFYAVCRSELTLFLFASTTWILN